MSKNKRPFSDKIYRGYLDRDGMWVESEDGPIEIRYDQFGEPWCIEHNCKLSQCKESH